MRDLLTRLQFSVSLLTERRVILFVILDALFIIAGVTSAVAGDSASSIYLPMFLVPALIIAVPMLADTVAVERRSGTLDLAMTSPGADWYFERRVGAVAALLIMQAWAGVLIARVAGEPFPLSGPMLQIAIVTAFLAATALNWTVRMRTSGAVIFAVYATVLAFSPWFFRNPVRPPGYQGIGPMQLSDYIDYFKTNAILAIAAVIFYLYARQRLSRPESLI